MYFLPLNQRPISITICSLYHHFELKALSGALTRGWHWERGWFLLTSIVSVVTFKPKTDQYHDLQSLLPFWIEGVFTGILSFFCSLLRLCSLRISDATVLTRLSLYFH